MEKMVSDHYPVMILIKDNQVYFTRNNSDMCLSVELVKYFHININENVMDFEMPGLLNNKSIDWFQFIERACLIQFKFAAPSKFFRN